MAYAQPSSWHTLIIHLWDTSCVLDTKQQAEDISGAA